MTSFVSIIIPVKDEPFLSSFINDLKPHLLTIPHEIIVVTSDKTKKPLCPLPSHIIVHKSFGDSLERAILLGFSVAQGEKIIVMDADGSHPPHHLSEMIAKLDNYEMVVASRFLEKGKYLTSPLRFLITFIFNQYAKLFGSTLTDPMSGYFGIQSQLLSKIKFKPYKWKVALEINNKLHPTTFEFPFVFHNRKNGKSKCTWKVGIKLIWDITVNAL